MVLLSSFNGEKYIREQIESIFKQKRCTIKLIVRDDGSSDNTLSIVQSLSRCYDIELISGHNIGYVSSFFNLISYALENGHNFDYFSLSDQDDVWDDDKLSVACDTINQEAKDIPILYGSTSRLVTEKMEFVSLSQKMVKPITFYNTIIQNFIPGHSQVMNRRLLEIVGNEIDCDKIYVHDSFITNCAVLCGKVLFDNEPHTNYRQHSFNQLGSEKGFFSWLRNRVKRLKRGDGKKYALQIEYICEKLNAYINKEEAEEMERFFQCGRHFFTRLSYVFKTRLYRQKKIESLAFKIHYLLGGYVIKSSLHGYRK